LKDTVREKTLRVFVRERIGAYGGSKVREYSDGSDILDSFSS